MGGIVTVLPNLAGLAWIQGRMVFYIAASYGFDPADPMRPAELLALWGVYSTPAEARAGLDGMAPHMALQYLDAKTTGDGQIASQLLKRLPAWALKRSALRVVPVLSAPLSAIAGGHSTRELGAKAIRFYGGA